MTKPPGYNVVNFFFACVIVFFFVVRLPEVVALYSNLFARVMIASVFFALATLAVSPPRLASQWVKRLGLIGLVKLKPDSLLHFF